MTKLHPIQTENFNPKEPDDQEMLNDWNMLPNSLKNINNISEKTFKTIQPKIPYTDFYFDFDEEPEFFSLVTKKSNQMDERNTISFNSEHEYLICHFILDFNNKNAITLMNKIINDYPQYNGKTIVDNSINYLELKLNIPETKFKDLNQTQIQDLIKITIKLDPVSNSNLAT